ncbi:hypothetical protein [Pedobacter foliorum]|uniref:hypothetical protein n=1 Tax=Pedobacter foliorum TaxID=2739058 RepID=UPI0015661A73|nr:hypothetical protein [Pedobacter foliorum]NRF37573.1 hypothetical protein [Pedobacter foliorum]
MMQRSFTISYEGDEFIRDQISKKQNFFFFNSFIFLGIVVVTGYLKLHVIDRGGILFGFCLFLVMMTLNLRHYFKFKKLKAQLIRSMQIVDDKIILTTYRHDTYEPVLYELPLENRVLTKGILSSKTDANKPLDIDVFGIPQAYTLSAEQDPKNKFYLAGSFWQQWDQMYELLEQRHKIPVA